MSSQFNIIVHRWSICFVICLFLFRKICFWFSVLFWQAGRSEDSENACLELISVSTGVKLSLECICLSLHVVLVDYNAVNVLYLQDSPTHWPQISLWTYQSRAVVPGVLLVDSFICILLTSYLWASSLQLSSHRLLCKSGLSQCSQGVAFMTRDWVLQASLSGMYDSAMHFVQVVSCFHRLEYGLLCQHRIWDLKAIHMEMQWHSCSITGWAQTNVLTRIMFFLQYHFWITCNLASILLSLFLVDIGVQNALIFKQSEQIYKLD